MPLDTDDRHLVEQSEHGGGRRGEGLTPARRAALDELERELAAILKTGSTNRSAN